jgi:WD40 repeat protein
VKVADFGLAKRLDVATHHTRTGDILGTPSYMAPEQADGRVHSVGPTADVYALGAILYEMVTGRPPFRGATPFETVNQVINHDPVSLRHLQPAVPRDLETICLKCLRKEPGRRYASALDLAEDLRRFLDGHPITARPVTVIERMTHWAKRKPALASLAATLLFGVLVGMPLLTFLYLRSETFRQQAETGRADATHQRNLAVDRGRELRRALYRSQIKLAWQAWDRGQVDAARELLARQMPNNDEDLRGIEWRYLTKLTAALGEKSFRHRSEVRGVALGPEGRILATGDAEGYVRLWNVATGAEIRSLPATGPSGGLGVTLGTRDGRFWFTAVTPGGAADGRIAPGDELIALGAPGTSLTETKERAFAEVFSQLKGEVGSTLEVEIRSPDQKQARRVTLTRRLLAPLPINGVLFDPRGTWVAAGSDDGFLRVWNAGDGAVLFGQRVHDAALTRLAVSGDGRVVATAGRDGVVAIWDTRPFKRRAIIPANSETIETVALDADGRNLAMGRANGVFQFWDVSGEPRRSGGVLSDTSYCVALSPDGRMAATGSIYGTITIWDLPGGSVRSVLSGHVEAVRDLAFSPDGQTLVSVGFDGGVRLWNPSRAATVGSRKGHRFNVTSVAFSPDGQTFATGGSDRDAIVWNARRSQEADTFPLRAPFLGALAMTPDSTRLITAGGTIPVSDEGGVAPPGVQLKAWALPMVGEGHVFQNLPDSITWLGFSPDGVRAAAAATGGYLDPQRTGEVLVWELMAPGSHRVFRGARSSIQSAAFSPDGMTIASVGGDVLAPERSGEVIFWDVISGAPRAFGQGGSQMARAIAYLVDGSSVLVGRHDGSIQILDAVSGTLRDQLPPALAGSVVSISLDARGHSLAVVHADLSKAGPAGVAIWNLPARRLRTKPLSLPFAPTVVALSGDGQKLAVGGHDRLAWWKLDAEGQPIGDPALLNGHTLPIHHVVFSTDNATLISVGYNPLLAGRPQPAEVKRWGIQKNVEMKPFEGQIGPVLSAAVARDGVAMVTGSEAGHVQLWDFATGREKRRLRNPLNVSDAHVAPLSAAVVSPDGRTLATGGYDRQIVLWDLPSAKPRRICRGHADPIAGLAFSVDGRTLLSCSGAAFGTRATKGSVKAWDVETGELRGAWDDFSCGVAAIAVSPDGQMLAIAIAFNTAERRPGEIQFRSFDAGTGRFGPVLACYNEREVVGSPFALAFSPDGHLLAATTYMETAIVVNSDRRSPDFGNRSGRLVGHTGRVTGIAFAPDGRTILTAAEDRSLRFWDARSFEEVLELAGVAPSSPVLVISPNGRWVTVGGYDGLQVVVRQLRTGD